MVGKYVHRSIQISASSAVSSGAVGKATSNEVEVDDSGRVVGADDEDALIRLIRREVRRALDEGK